MKNLLFNMMVWHSTARSNGGNWMDAEGNITVDSPAYRTALELYKRLYDAGVTPKDSTTYEYAEANAAFGSGQAATMLQWNAAFADLDSAEKTPAVAGKIGTVAPPSGPDGRFTHIHGLGLGINKTSQNKEGAKKFIAWLATPEAIELLRQGRRLAGSERCDHRQDLGRPSRPRQAGQFAGQRLRHERRHLRHALQIYELQAKEFTAYWTGEKSLDDALAATAAGMTELLKQQAGGAGRRWSGARFLDVESGRMPITERRRDGLWLLAPMTLFLLLLLGFPLVLDLIYSVSKVGLKRSALRKSSASTTIERQSPIRNSWAAAWFSLRFGIIVATVRSSRPRPSRSSSRRSSMPDRG